MSYAGGLKDELGQCCCGKLVEDQKDWILHVPYAILISKVLDHLKVDVHYEINDFVKLEFELKTKVLKQMGYVEADEQSDWIEKPKKTTTEETEDKPMSPFELMLMAKMDENMRMQKEDQGELKECFESILERLDAIGHHMLMIFDFTLSHPSLGSPQSLGQ